MQLKINRYVIPNANGFSDISPNIKDADGDFADKGALMSKTKETFSLFALRYRFNSEKLALNYCILFDCTVAHKSLTER